MSWTECEIPAMGSRRQKAPILSLGKMGKGYILRLNNEASRLTKIVQGDLVKIEREGDVYRVRKTLENEKGAHGVIINVSGRALGFSAAGAVLSRAGYLPGRVDVLRCFEGSIVFDPSPLKPEDLIELPEERKKVGRPRKFREVAA